MGQQIVWTEDNNYDDPGTPAPSPSVAAAFYRTAVTLTEPALPPKAQTPREANDAPFERDESEGCSLCRQGWHRRRGEPSWFDVSIAAAPIGLVSFRGATHGAPGLLGASHWCARSPDGRCVNRTLPVSAWTPSPRGRAHTRGGGHAARCRSRRRREHVGVTGARSPGRIVNAPALVRSPLSGSVEIAGTWLVAVRSA